MDRPGWFYIEEQPTAGVLRQKALETTLHRIEINPPKGYEALLTPQMARELAHFDGLSELVLWCKVDRGAINEIVTLPDLKSLVIIFGITGEGPLHGFDKALALEKFACDYDIVEADLLEIAAAPALRILRAHYAKPTLASIKAIVKLPHLVSLDFEDSAFDDQMAQLVASSPHIIELEIGGSQITAKGLLHISSMKQLKKLDVWATGLHMDDLECLRKLPNLEFLSVGSAVNPQNFSGQALIEKLEAITSLKRLWLDGVSLSDEQIADLRAHYKDVFVSENRPPAS